jgi:hypothetical protein
MRIWSLHPKYLDVRGLVALWREALLAQKVLHGGTKGYQRHPQLARFRSHPRPTAAIAEFLRAIHAESVRRGYSFDSAKIGAQRTSRRLTCTCGQLLFEWEHLKRKLRQRNPARYRDLLRKGVPEPHPLFTVVPGECEHWEIIRVMKKKRAEKKSIVHKILDFPQGFV